MPLALRALRRRPSFEPAREGAQCQYPKHDLIFRSVYPRDDIALARPRPGPLPPAMLGSARLGHGGDRRGEERGEL